MNKEFVPYEEALALKELGFDEECLAVYINGKFVLLDEWLYSTNQDTFIESKNLTAPLYQQAFRWFREKYKLYHTINHLPHKKGTNEEFLCEANVSEHSYHSIYEEAELACLRKLIEIVKEK